MAEALYRNAIGPCQTVRICPEIGRMVLGTFGHDWLVRLEKLRAIRGEFPDGPQWLWSIRIRILEFLVSRYSNVGVLHQRVTRESIDDPAAPMDLESEWVWPGVPMHNVVLDGVEHPPRSRETIASALDRIEQSHENSQSPRWKSRKPEAAWTWWRETYACR